MNSVAEVYQGYNFTKNHVVLHKNDDFIAMRKSGQLASRVLDYITPLIKPGITTGKINDLCHEFIIENGAIPAPLNYRGFPKSVCTSINQVVCHGIPSHEKYLKDGDIINVDVTVIVDGWHGDTSRTFCVGKVSNSAQKLVDITYEAMMIGIEMVRPGVKLGDIGKQIEDYVKKNGYSCVKEFCGHGIGRIFHMSPDVLHYHNHYDLNDCILEEGMFFTIEPMVNQGKWQTKILNDGWTAVTIDGKLSAQFEHSLGVTSDGFEIFTAGS